jgi:hypothetical protein
MQLTKDELDALADQHRVPGHATMIDHRAFAAAVIAEHTAKVLEDVEPVAWLDTVIDWTATGQPITRRICIQAQCGDWALSYIESALRETATTDVERTTRRELRAWQAAIQHARDVAVRACESRIMGDHNREDQEAQRCADAIKEALK